MSLILPNEFGNDGQFFISPLLSIEIFLFKQLLKFTDSVNEVILTEKLYSLITPQWVSSDIIVSIEKTVVANSVKTGLGQL